MSVLADNTPEPTEDEPPPIPVMAGPMGHGPVVPPIINGSEFTSSFVNVTKGQTLNISWTPIDAKYEPLSITARAINRTATNRANSFLVTIAPNVANTSSFSWTSVPAPLQYMPTGLYEVEIRPAVWNLSANEPGSLTVPVLARSSFFTIEGAGGAGSSTSSGHGGHKGGNNNSNDPNGVEYDQSEAKQASAVTHRRLALGLGISLGLAGALALAGLLYFIRRNALRRADEAQREREKRAEMTD